MKHHIICLGIVTLLVTVPSPVLAESVCATPAEARAERARILQTELMVAALKCRGREDLALYEKYNTFVQKFMPQLVTHGKVLTSYFKRRYGNDFRPQMDRYITSLANTISVASDKTPDFCEVTTAAVEDALKASPDRIAAADFDLRISPKTGIDTCPETAGGGDSHVVTAASDD